MSRAFAEKLKVVGGEDAAENMPAAGSGSIFEQLDVYGVGPVEDAILAGLVTGDPVLLLGGHGSAKTLLIRRIARTLGMSFHAYDASKALFEDVIGFPNPDDLKRGVVGYIPTVISIWGKQFILIDEISRANPSLQNKWLEVIRSRQVMGKKIEGLTYVFAAMNPPGYLGAYPLDAALAGRFAFIIRMPEAKDMPKSDVSRIISHISEDDAPGLHEGGNGETQLDLATFIGRARQRFNRLAEKSGRAVNSYVLNLSASFTLHRKPLDGRRLGMIWRNILAYMAVVMEKEGNDDIAAGQLDVTLFKCLTSSLPFEASGEGNQESLTFMCHQTAFKLFTEGEAAMKGRLRMFMGRSPIEMVREYESIWRELGENDHAELVTFIEEGMNSSKEPAEIVRFFLALKRIVHAYQKERVKADQDTMRRAMRLYVWLLGPMRDLNLKSLFALDPTTHPKIDVGDPLDALALRLSVEMTMKSNDSSRRYSRHRDEELVEAVKRVFQHIRLELGRQTRKQAGGLK